jgi:nitrogen regulatory protein PII
MVQEANKARERGCVMAQELILVVFNSSIEEEMTEALDAAGMTCYTKVPGVQGVGTCSEPRLDSHVWPGTNTMFMVVVDSTSKERILEAIRKMKEIHREEGVSAFVLPITTAL